MRGTPPDGHPPIVSVPQTTPYHTTEEIDLYVDVLYHIDFDAVVEDIKNVLTDSKSQWPADFGNYGPFFIRLAWHCSGSYRRSDGRGGCDGGRIRHGPEKSWPDNGNLDKALDVLRPVKEKYGLGLSWGDLIVLAGNTAIHSMGGPNIGFCGGRLDDANGADSLDLGPSEQQEEEFPCLKPDGTPDAGNSQCQAPLGAVQVGLIYVNPAGPVHPNGTRNVDPVASALEIREVFGRMGFDDEMTVAVIGGGHAFGKCHGDPNGVSTSGFEGSWTTAPTTWTNLYFTELFRWEDKWEVWDGPNNDAESPQWRIRTNEPGRSDIMMLTSDLAMIKDPSYRDISQRFADSITDLEQAFGKAWYALMSRDMGPWARCFGARSGVNSVPPPQDWQLDLPPPQNDPTLNFPVVKGDIRATLTSDTTKDEMAYLGFRCAATFRYTDMMGGCNGALIRFSPESQWPINLGVNKTIESLKPVFDRHQAKGLTWADLITLAGIVAVEESGSDPIDFCGGMIDADQGAAQVYVSNTLATSGSNEMLKWRMELMGLTMEEVVALVAMPRGDAVMKQIGRQGSWSSERKGVTNEFFRVLLSETWEEVPGTSRPVEYKATGKMIYISEHDKEILETPAMKEVAESFRDDPTEFKMAFQKAWTKISGLRTLRRAGVTVVVPDDPPESLAVRVGSMLSAMAVALTATTFAQQ